MILHSPPDTIQFVGEIKQNDVPVLLPGVHLLCSTLWRSAASDAALAQRVLLGLKNPQVIISLLRSAAVGAALGFIVLQNDENKKF